MKLFILITLLAIFHSSAIANMYSVTPQSAIHCGADEADTYQPVVSQDGIESQIPKPALKSNFQQNTYQHQVNSNPNGQPT